MKKILIIEDDPAILAGLEETLKAEHFEVTGVQNGEMGYEKAIKDKFDLIILDLILPDVNGIDICKNIRSKGISTPILMLTSRKEEMDKVLGLELGADDYVTKPFSVKELVARVKALLRRQSELIKDIEEYSFGDIYVNFKSHDVRRKDKDIQISTMELKILKYLVIHEGEVIERNKLLDEVWGYENFPSTRTVDNFILSLRKKIEDDPSKPTHLLTVFGAGYKFVK
ncbi:response regulator transcription factor [bacterium BMS3Abin03]|nr:response regulator transcription factor [bacterium BMS3Abin03]